MVRDTLTAVDLHDLDPEELLQRALHDDRVLRLVFDAVRIKRRRLTGLMGVTADHSAATLEADAPIGDVVEALARDGFTANWLLSYEYGGEAVNLVRFHYDPERHPDQPWRQLHVRIFDDGTLEAHEEANALMHKGAHIREESFDQTYGTAAVAAILGDADVDVAVIGEDV